MGRGCERLSQILAKANGVVAEMGSEKRKVS